MDLMQIMQRSLSGYVFVVPGLLLYFLILKKKGRKQTPAHIITAFVFCYYLIGVLTMTGIGKMTAFSPRLVLIPFLDMISGPVDTLLNVLLFIPLGLFLPVMYRKYNHISKIALTGFLFSLAIELVQMFGRGATDINDLITNTAGACLGYCFYKLLYKLVRKEYCEKFQAICINEYKEILFFVIYSFVIMVTIQPFIIGTFFGLG
ncbi:MAG: VanZ family protein [Eubacterium sp.]|nr:VanZ family protein [Eubacterium sp.]